MKTAEKYQIKKVGLSECENFRKYCIVCKDKQRTRVLTNNLDKALTRLEEQGMEIAEIFEQELNQETLNRPTNYMIICESVDESETLAKRLQFAPNQKELFNEFFGVQMRREGLAFYFSAPTYFNLKDYISVFKLPKKQ